MYQNDVYMFARYEIVHGVIYLIYLIFISKRRKKEEEKKKTNGTDRLPWQPLRAESVRIK